jgi:hypothetical protein
MASKKPSKIIFCRYSYPLVEELGEFYSGKIRQATNIVTVQNQVIAPAGGKIADEFYFLNATIAGETHIITAAGQKNYPTNDPAIVAKLEQYLASLERPVAGNAQKRGVGLQFIPAYEERLESETYLEYKCADDQAGTILQELHRLYRDNISAYRITIKNKPAVRIRSWYIRSDALLKAIVDIINS